MRRTIAFALVGGLALTACSGTSSGAGSTSLSAKRAASKQVTTTSSTTPFVDGTTHTPGTLTGYEGARSDVHDTTCAADGKAWTARGKVTNSASSNARYRIYVSFLHGDTTVGIAETAAGPVKAAATTAWDAKVKVHTEGLRCILRVERSTA